MKRTIAAVAAFAALLLLALSQFHDAESSPRRRLGRNSGYVATAAPIDAGAMDAFPDQDVLLTSVGNGQSNNGGVDNDGGASMTDTGLRSSDAGITVLTEVGAASNETPATAIANYLKGAWGPDSCIGNAFLSNTPISGWGPGTNPYQRSRDMVTQCAGAGAALKSGSVARLIGIWIGGGENDEGSGRTVAQYGGDVVNYYTNAQNDYTAQVNGHVPLFQAPHCASTELSTNVPTAETSLGAWYATTQNPRICISTPTCQLAWIANNPHMMPQSACLVGLYHGRAMRKYWVQQQGCLGRVVDASRVTAAGNVITVCTKGGDGSALVLDTSNVAQKGAYYGFYFTDSQADTPAITSVAINGSNNQCVDLTLTRNVDCTAAPQVAYMDYGIASIDPGGANAQSVGGNVRDSDPTTSTLCGGTLNLYNWLAGFRTPVTSCSASAQAFTWANTHSLDSNGNAANALSGRNANELNGLADATWCLWTRSNAATWPTTANVVWQRFHVSQNQFDMRTTSTAGTLRMFVPTTLSDAANFTTCTGYVGQTWQHTCFVKSGATLTGYLDAAVNAGCTLTGSVPANLTSPTRSTWMFLGAIGSSANFNTRDMAVWTRALNIADVRELFCGNRSSCSGAAASNPCALSTGAPVHGWPLNGTYEDCGSGTSIPLTPYGPGLSFEAIHPN